MKTYVYTADTIFNELFNQIKGERINIFTNKDNTIILVGDIRSGINGIKFQIDLLHFYQHRTIAQISCIIPRMNSTDPLHLYGNLTIKESQMNSLICGLEERTGDILPDSIYAIIPNITTRHPRFKYDPDRKTTELEYYNTLNPKEDNIVECQFDINKIYASGTLWPDIPFNET